VTHVDAGQASVCTRGIHAWFGYTAVSAAPALCQVVDVAQLQRERYKLQTQEYKYFVGRHRRLSMPTAWGCAKQVTSVQQQHVGG
jgi:hypothetical protein